MHDFLPPRVSPTAHTLFQELDGQMVLLDTTTERYFRLDAIGSEVWRAWVVRQEEPAALVARLHHEYAVDEATVRRDLAALFEQLRAAGFVEAAA